MTKYPSKKIVLEVFTITEPLPNVNISWEKALLYKPTKHRIICPRGYMHANYLCNILQNKIKTNKKQKKLIKRFLKGRLSACLLLVWFSKTSNEQLVPQHTQHNHHTLASTKHRPMTQIAFAGILPKHEHLGHSVPCILVHQSISPSIYLAFSSRSLRVCVVILQYLHMVTSKLTREKMSCCGI